MIAILDPSRSPKVRTSPMSQVMEILSQFGRVAEATFRQLVLANAHVFEEVARRIERVRAAAMHRRSLANVTPGEEFGRAMAIIHSESLAS